MTLTLVSDNSAVATDLGNANKSSGSQAAIMQGYALSVQRQTMLNFGDFENLKKFETDMNNGIAAAQGRAKGFLDRTLPNLIRQSTDIDSYFNLQNALGQALDPSAPAKDAIMMMSAAQEQAQQYQKNAGALVTDLTQLRDGLNGDASNFTTYVQNLNAAVAGDNGVLKSLDDQLSSIDGKIAGAIAGTALSGLTILGGGLMIAIGAIAEFVTAGTSTALVIAGVGVVAVGAAGETASAITLAAMLNQKSDMLRRKEMLKAEVQLAQGVSSGFSTLAGGAAELALAAQQMANAWSGLDQHLGNLIGHLKSGQTDVDAMRRLFQIAAQGDVKNVQADSRLIQAQLAGVNVQNLTGGQTVSDFLNTTYGKAA